MKIVFISDTHNKHTRISVPDGDILVHCGDFTGMGYAREIASFNTWLGTLKHSVKLICAGNHDISFERDHHFAKSLITNGTYLEHESITVNGVSFFLSPYSPEFRHWAFMKKRGEDILQKWEEIPEGIDVLVTHGPPHSVLDSIMLGSESLGCEDLYREVILRVRPRICAFGHIHGSGGKTESHYGIQFINASICDEEYQTTHKPVVVEL